MQLHGTFSISDWQESTTTSPNPNEKLTKAVVRQSYSGDILGASEIHYQMHYLADGNACFNGFEYITCDIDNRPTELILSHVGQFEQGVASSAFTVIKADNLPSLLGLKGHFKSTENGQAEYFIGTEDP